MRVTITKKFEFEAAHRLPKHKGICANVHGHTYKLEVEVEREDKQMNEEGMIVDFSILKQLVNVNIIELMDHKYLNDIFEDPTAENMVFWIFNKLKGVFLDHNMCLVRVRLYETSNSYAEAVV